MSKFCTNCGNAVEENEQFCNNCGTALNETAQAPAQANPISINVPDFKDKKVISYLIAAGALLLQFIFYFVGGLSVSVSFTVPFCTTPLALEVSLASREGSPNLMT